MLVVKGDFLNQGVEPFHEKHRVPNRLKYCRFVAFGHVPNRGGIAASPGANAASSTTLSGGDGRGLELRLAHSGNYMSTIVDGRKNVLL
jgi:hypothetical protein